MKLQKAKELTDQITMDDRIKWNGIPRYTHIVFAPIAYIDNPFLYFEKITFPANIRVDSSFEVVFSRGRRRRADPICSNCQTNVGRNVGRLFERNQVVFGIQALFPLITAFDAVKVYNRSNCELLEDLVGSLRNNHVACGARLTAAGLRVIE